MGRGRSENESMSTSNEEIIIPGHVIPHQDTHAHRLVLSDEVRDYNGILCSSCGTPIRSGWSYSCIPCKLGVHKNCPSHTKTKPTILLPESRNSRKKQFTISDLKSQDLSHTKVVSSYDICVRCGERCTGTFKSEIQSPGGIKGYGCHESCYSLPDEIQHPFHPHKLELRFTQSSSSCCYACRSKPRRSNSNIRGRVLQVYLCMLCTNFYLHIQCAQQMPVLTHWSHPQHPLVLIRLNQEAAHPYNDIKCNLCGHGWPVREMGQYYGVYRCVPCNFSIHETCINYHPIIDNPGEHHHSLQFIQPHMEEAPAAELQQPHRHDYEWTPLDYCEACGHNIVNNYPLYKCFDCPNEFLFHPDCALTSSDQEVSAYPEDSLQQFEELCESFAKEKCNAPFPSLLLLQERISESAGNVECLALELEEDIRRLTALKLIRKGIEGKKIG